MLAVILGSLCLAYLAFELGRAAHSPARAAFGAVDCATGRPLEVTLDRRVRSRRHGER